MRGLIGHPLGHSYSPIIHKSIIDKEYKLYDLTKEEMIKLLKEKNFDSLNVTIPYKEKVIPYLDELSEAAKKIKAINCIKNFNGKLIGHNSDYDGFMWLLKNNDINLDNKNVAILGSGGSSKAVKSVVETFKTKNIYLVSSSNKENTISYEDLYNLSNINCIINTTPVGMYPNMDESVIDISKFKDLEVVVDIIYNPFRTKLLVDAINHNIKAVGGIDMLVAQGVKAVEFFDDIKIEDYKIKEVINKIVNDKRNIVLIGMPGSGKSTIGKMLSTKLNMEFKDTDELIEKETNMEIKDIFKLYGEEKFREIEKNVIKSLQDKSSCIISCGGGIIKDIENINYLRKNGVIIYLDRDIENIYLNDKRPLTQNKDDLIRLYKERLPLYKKYSDYIIENNKDAIDAIKQIEMEINL